MSKPFTKTLREIHRGELMDELDTMKTIYQSFAPGKRYHPMTNNHRRQAVKLFYTLLSRKGCLVREACEAVGYLYGVPGSTVSVWQQRYRHREI